MGTWEAAISLNLEQFDALFEPGPATVPGYLVLLNLKDTDAPAVFNQLRSAVHASGGELDRLIATMLAHANWRPQLVGATALLVAPSEEGIKALWSALDRPCWTSPQLAAVASRVDSDFIAKARHRLQEGCPMRLEEAAKMSMIERHSALGPTSLDAHSAKLASALAALCRQDCSGETWLAVLFERADLSAAIDSDVDNAASIALHWRDGIDGLIAALE